MVISVHQAQYIPWLGFFDKVDQSDVFVFLDDVQYKHREFQNRNKIRTKDGWMWLTVPVLDVRGAKIKDIAIDASRDWPGSHLKSLRAWYAKAPYFEKYFPRFESLLAREWRGINELNIAVIRILFEALGIEKKVYLETALGAGGEKTARIIAIAKKLGARAYLSGAGGKDYLSENDFKDAGIVLKYQDYRHPVYRQQFMTNEKDFIPYMSVIDLLFNEGDKSLKIIRGGSRHV